jgi:hypothetical protein
MKHPKSHKKERKGGDERAKRVRGQDASDRAESEHPGSAFQSEGRNAVITNEPEKLAGEQERQEVGISQSCKEPGAFESQLRFVVPNGHFDLPATSINKDDLPGELGGMSGLGSEKIPGGLVLTSSHDQPEGLVMGGIEDREGNHAGFAFTLVAGIPEHPVVPGAFAFGDLAPQKGLGEPGIARKAAIPDVRDFLAPQLVNVIEDLDFFDACLAGRLASGGPPMHVCEGGRALPTNHDHSSFTSLFSSSLVFSCLSASLGLSFKMIVSGCKPVS